MLPYKALITEVLLQRTRAEAVQKIYSKFFDRFPNPETLSFSSEEEVRSVIKHLGFGFRAGNLVKLGRAIANGIPDEMDSLLKLPNIGIYAAGAYLSLHRGKRAIIPDANAVRILGRLFGFEIKPETRKSKAFLQLCEKLTPKRRFREFNYAILDLGRLICKPRKPLCKICVLNNVCFYAKGHMTKYNSDH